VRRNLDRGVSAKDLNISYFKEKEMQVKKKVDNLTGIIRSKIREGEDYIKQNWTETRNELIQSMEQQELLRGFVSLFGNDGPVVRVFDGGGNDESKNCCSVRVPLCVRDTLQRKMPRPAAMPKPPRWTWTPRPSIKNVSYVIL
jgi:hypothetical protein